MASLPQWGLSWSLVVVKAGQFLSFIHLDYEKVCKMLQDHCTQKVINLDKIIYYKISVTWPHVKVIYKMDRNGWELSCECAKPAMDIVVSLKPKLIFFTCLSYF